jgi:hypothetical protein
MRVRLAVVIVVVGLTRGAAAQNKTLGPSGCIACHDHSRQALKWQKEEPAALGVKAHFNTRKQLDAPKAAAYAKAIGLADPYDLKGSCVQCHATVFKGDANAGVSCESCHGPASGYNEPHQPKGSYAKAVSLGLHDLRGKPDAIAKTCVECHVTPDKRLAAAGHPAGEKFDAGVSLQKVVHWNTTYDYAAVSATGRRLGAARLGGKPAPPPVSPPSNAGQAPPPATAPPAAATAKPGAVKPASSAGAPTTPSAASEPWNFDLPVRELPADYPSDTSADPAATEAPAAVPAPASRRRVKPTPEPSLAYEAPIPPVEPGIADTGPLAAAVAPAVGGAAAVGGEAVVAPAAPPDDARSRAVALIERALRAGARDPSLPPAAKPEEFAGPDGELLRVQDEALVLALEALRRPQ